MREHKEMIMDHFRDTHSACSHIQRCTTLHNRLGALLIEVVFGEAGKAYVEHGKVKKQTA